MRGKTPLRQRRYAASRWPEGTISARIDCSHPGGRLTSGRAGGRSVAGGGGMFTGVKVFSATKAKERDHLGEQVTRWLRANADLEIVDRTGTQSSDNEFHCLTVILFSHPKHPPPKPPPHPPQPHPRRNS